MADIELTDMRVEPVADGSRVTATVDGTELWLESTDTVLVAAPEVWASALLPAAVVTGRRLVVDAPLDPVWVERVPSVLQVWNEWWSTPSDPDEVLTARPDDQPRPRPARGVGLCFSLGVDSFYSLLCRDATPDVLLLVEGFDVALGDDVRMAPIEAAVREVARERGLRTIVVRTNLREHPSYPEREWERTHGGALAGIGHACARDMGRLLISSTKPYIADNPWGSHWDTDPGWSGTSLEVEHVGAERRRNEKLRLLVDYSLVRRHLRVCWENRSPAGNCGVCEKCVRTQLVIAGLGRLDEFVGFPQDTPLADRLDVIPPVPEHMVYLYQAVLSGVADPELRAAGERLIERSRTAPR